MHVCLFHSVLLCCRSFCLVHKVVGGRGVLEAAAAAAEAGGSQQGSVASVKQQLKEFLGRQRVAASLALGRRLWPHEEEALVYPRLCEVCGRMGEAGEGPGMCCGVCHCVYYCSERHRAADRTRHGQWCKLYALSVVCDRWVPTIATTTCLALPAALDKEYQPLPCSMATHLAATLGQDRAREPAAAAFLSELLTFPLTALFVLESMLPALASAQRLSLHLVGAEEGHEPAMTVVWEYLLHRLPCLTWLHVLLVGPQLTVLEGSHEAVLCRQCQEDGRQVVLESRKSLYHQFMAEATTGPPDLRLAFNCGFHEWAGATDDTWPPSLALMVADSTPLAFTSYMCHEAEQDLLAVQMVAGPELEVVTAGLNPYHSLRPLRDWARENGQQLYHNNQYLTVVRGRQPAMANVTA